MITIHVGLHKTGTSSIQAALDRSAASALNGGAYWGSGGMLVRNGVLRTGAAVEVRRLARARDVVLSSEGFLGDPWDVYSGAESVARALADCFTGHDFQVVLYVRPQPEWVTSVYTQRIQEGGTERPEAFVRRMLAEPHLRHTELVASVVRGLGGPERLIVRPFGSTPNVVEEFFKTMDFAEPYGGGGGPRANVSITARQVAVMRSVSQSSPGLSRLARMAYQRERVGGADRGGSPLQESLQEELHELFQQDWARLPWSVAGTKRADPGSFELVARQNASWAPVPFVGSDLTDEAVADEALATIVELLPRAMRDDPSGPRLGRRVVRKLRRDPADFPRAAARAARRWTGTS